MNQKNYTAYITQKTQSYMIFHFKQNHGIQLILIIFGIIYLINSQPVQNCTYQCQELKYQQCNTCFSVCVNNTQQIYNLLSCEKQITDQPSLFLPQQTCKQTCCNLNSNDIFTKETLDQCISYNDYKASQSYRAMIVNLVIGIGAIIVLPLLLILTIACCIKHREKIAGCVKKLCKKDRPQVIFVQNSPEYPKGWFSIENQNPQNIQKKGAQPQQTQQIRSCSICLQQNTFCKTLCNHDFHLGCLKQWILRKQICPVCRGRNYNPVKLTCQQCKKRARYYYIGTQYIQYIQNDQVSYSHQSSQTSEQNQRNGSVRQNQQNENHVQYQQFAPSTGSQIVSSSSGNDANNLTTQINSASTQSSLNLQVCIKCQKRSFLQRIRYQNKQRRD